MDCKNSSTHLRDASFSSYLSTTEENFVVKLAESCGNPSLASTSSEVISSSVSLGRTKAEEGEISVFGAEKYFNMQIDDESPISNDSSVRKQWHKKENNTDLHHTRPRIRPGSSSASSEASWNSQTVLLPSFMRSLSQSKQKKAIGYRFFAGFGCNRSSCSDEKSVYIDKNVARGGVQGKDVRKKTIQADLNPVMSVVGFNKEENFAFPILNSGLHNLTSKRQLQEAKAEEARVSLEVFGSKTKKKGDIALDLERKLSVLTWDAIPKAQNLPTTSRSSGMCDDIESDASSDLFEIENISGSAQPLFGRQGSDGMSRCMTPTTLYEPSEASIEWSVVTASAADFSVISDYDEKKLACDEMNSTTRTSKTSTSKLVMGKEAQKSRPGGLLGCRSQKAIGVAETAHRSNEKVNSDSRWHQRPISSMPTGKLQDEIKVKDFEFPQVPRAIASRTLSSSHAPLSLYTQ